MDDAPLPYLSAEAISNLAASWSDGGLWDDIIWLSHRFHTASEYEATVCWHHLVMAVGNFKRQPGRRLRPTRLTEAAPVDHDHVPVVITIPGVDPPLQLKRDEPESWHALRRGLPGAGAATTATLLAALWPDQHFVYDRRVHAAANGLRLAAGMAPTREIVEAALGSRVTIENYIAVRNWLLSTATATGQRLTNVERSLYTLSQSIRGDSARARRDYAAIVAGRAAEAAS